MDNKLNEDFLNAVSKMRHFQNCYFKYGRSSFNLKEAMKWEKKVDAILAEISPKQTTKPQQQNLF